MTVSVRCFPARWILYVPAVGHTLGPPPGDVSVDPLNVKVWSVGCPFNATLPMPFFRKYSVYVPAADSGVVIVVPYAPEIVVVAAPPLPHPARSMTDNATAGASVIFVPVLIVSVCRQPSLAYGGSPSWEPESSDGVVGWASVPE